MDFRPKRRRGSTEVNLTPLIDIVFQLLIFFLITTTFVENPGIEVELPKANAQSVEGESQNVIIAVTKEGRFVLEGQAMSEEELEERLTSRHKQSKGGVVIVQADTKTNHGKVVQVMDIARRVGFSQLAIATSSQ